MSEEITQAVGAPLERKVRHQLATADDMRSLATALEDAFPREAIDLDALARVLATLGAIDRHSVTTIKTNSSERDDWRDDMAFAGKLARGH